MEVLSNLRFVTSVGDFNNNIEVTIGKSSLEVKIDKKHLFNTLKHRKEIIGLLNKKLDEMVEDYISKKAEEQEQIQEDL